MRNNDLNTPDGVMREAIERYGVRSQVTQLIEEMGELQVALCHWMRLRGSEDEIIEEIADVKVCLDQICLFLDCDYAVCDIKAQKIIRLRERLEKGGIL